MEIFEVLANKLETTPGFQLSHDFSVMEIQQKQLRKSTLDIGFQLSHDFSVMEIKMSPRDLIAYMWSFN